ncbi:MAG: aminotransferase class IV, partial [candidate division WOR-3 bacterium]|nr:aminotransferase class IV [candidate division WOR-3 bacterium]
MPLQKAKYIWMDGKLVPWDDAKIHINSHVIHYGTGVFEGLRCYKTPKGSVIFRLQDHTERLFNSAKIYRMDIPYTKDEINKAIIETIKANEQEECYIRPLVYRG